MTANTLITLRIVLFAATGLICLAYAGMALWLGTPAPMPQLIPAVFGIATGVILTISSRRVGDEVADAVWDEGHDVDVARTTARSFWFSILLYPVFALLMGFDLVDPIVTFAAMGTLVGGVFCLMHSLTDLQGRV
ncbi:MAG: hypothetical protein AAGH17_05005 [Pseudomonadota bacterium]